MGDEHPVFELRRMLVNEFSANLPVGVHPVSEWCREPQFFPGATGLLVEKSWAEVVPDRAGLVASPPPPPRRGVVVVGNYQASLASYQRVLDGTIGGFSRTWGALRQLLANIPPGDVFLTNAYIGLPDVSNDQAPFPTTPGYSVRCGRLLRREIELFEPRCVVCLGVPTAKMLATITPRLESWRPWPGFPQLARTGRERVDRCRLGGAEFVAVAVAHPSARVSSLERQRQADLISAAATPS